MKCSGLSRRQSEIAAHVAQGLTNKEIAARMALSEKTVANHIRAAAESLPGHGWPRHRITLWYFSLTSDISTD